MHLGAQLVNGEYVEINAGSEYGKELRKWEANFTVYGPPLRPYVYREYPHMMYRPKRSAKNGEVTFDSQIAEHEQQREELERQGYYFGGQGEAMKGLERQEFEYAELAANRHALERTMSDKAQGEAAAIDDTTIKHLPVIPEANKTSGRRG